MRWNQLFACVVVATASLFMCQTASAQVQYGDWKPTPGGNYSRKCTFPGGGHQYIMCFPQKPDWVYWYNPKKQVYWCCCPTKRNPYFNNDVLAGKDQFLKAITPTGNIQTTVFPANANFNAGKTTAKDIDGSDVDLGCPPSDLPPGV